MLLVRVLRQGLSESISSHVGCPFSLESDLSLLDELAKEVVTTINVSASITENWILGHSDAGIVVLKYHSGFHLLIPEVSQKMTEI